MKIAKIVSVSILCLTATCVVGSAQQKAVNLATGSSVRVSSVANIAWGPSGVTDGDYGPSRGWVATYSAQEKPWVEIRLTARKSVKRISLTAARFPQVRANRFSRPHTVRVVFSADGKVSGTVKLEMKDDENTRQEFVFDPVAADTIRFSIEDIYKTNAQFPNMAGFQEVEIFPADTAIKDESAYDDAPETSAPRNTPKNSDRKPTAIEAPDDVASDETGGHIDAEEQAILDSLQRFMDMMRKKFMRD